MADGDGAITFVQYREPPLVAGEYKLTATQKVAAGAETETLQAEQSFHVAGPRLTLDPGVVTTSFPPSGAQGEFSNVLPHVVLSQPGLPWQGDVGSKPRQGACAWLALLLFDAGDPPPDPHTVTLADLKTADHVICPPRDGGPGETPTDPVQVIDVPVAVFNAIAPSVDDLSWLAHVRHTTPDQKPTTPDGSPAPTDFAVIVGNRLPKAGALATAHLVSFEGAGPYLPAADGTASAALPSDATAVRLVTLHSWSFTAVDVHGTFEGTAKELCTEPSSLRRPDWQGPVDPRSRGASEAIQNAVLLGYAPLEHGLRSGDWTASWYRGPLLPLGSPPTAAPPYATADELLRYDPSTGMLDVSYAAAWQLGRLMALRDAAFAAAVYRWKLARTQDAVGALEQRLIDRELGMGAPRVAAAEGASHGADPAARLRHVAGTFLRPAADRIAEGGGGEA